MSYNVTTDELIRIVLMPLGLADGKPSCDLANEAVEELRARIQEDKDERARNVEHNARITEQFKKEKTENV